MTIKTILRLLFLACALTSLDGILSASIPPPPPPPPPPGLIPPPPGGGGGSPAATRRAATSAEEVPNSKERLAYLKEVEKLGWRFLTAAEKTELTDLKVAEANGTLGAAPVGGTGGPGDGSATKTRQPTPTTAGEESPTRLAFLESLPLVGTDGITAGELSEKAKLILLKKAGWPKISTGPRPTSPLPAPDITSDEFALMVYAISKGAESIAPGKRININDCLEPEHVNNLILILLKHLHADSNPFDGQKKDISALLGETKVEITLDKNTMKIVKDFITVKNKKPELPEYPGRYTLKQVENLKDTNVPVAGPGTGGGSGPRVGSGTPGTETAAQKNERLATELRALFDVVEGKIGVNTTSLASSAGGKQTINAQAKSFKDTLVDSRKAPKGALDIFFTTKVDTDNKKLIKIWLNVFVENNIDKRTLENIITTYLP
ncbi:hypothetical protein K2W90_05360 [Candidatus Babeliales bacterium]|nr:hypothetical protein [Candidatus Babeliales bacterium]